MWYHLTETPTRRVRARLAEMSPIQRDYNNRRFVIRLGQTLEIATFRALADTSYDFHGRFTDLDDHDDSTPYSKEEPPTT